MSEKKVLITGGGSGIGFAIAESLSAVGYKPILAGRTLARLEDAAARIAGAVPLQFDITKETSVSKSFDWLSKNGLMPDILVNNAGAATTAPLDKTSLELWQQMLSVNLTGAFLCSRAALPHMKHCGFGRIITVASTAGLKGYAYTAAYTAAKHGVIGMTRSLALELAGTGITANAVCPGFTDTNIVGDAIKIIVAKTGRGEDQALGELTKHNPEGRLVTPQEVASTVAWLASEGASAINGQSLAVACGEIM